MDHDLFTSLSSKSKVDFLLRWKPTDPILLTEPMYQTALLVLQVPQEMKTIKQKMRAVKYLYENPGVGLDDFTLINTWCESFSRYLLKCRTQEVNALVSRHDELSEFEKDATIVLSLLNFGHYCP
jgi:hypothetical protein